MTLRLLAAVLVVAGPAAAQEALPSFQLAVRAAYLPAETEFVGGTGYAGAGIRGYTEALYPARAYIDIGYYLTDLDDLNADGSVNAGKEILQGEVGITRRYGPLRPELAVVFGLIGFDEDVSADDQSALLGTRFGVGFTPTPNAARLQPWVTVGGSYYGVPGGEGFFLVNASVGVELLKVR